MKIRIINLITGLLILLTAPIAQAIDIDISGYASFAGTVTTAKDTTGNRATYYNGLADKNLKFNTDDTHVGLQLSAAVSDKVDMTVVLHADGGLSNYNIEAQWAYATYRFNDEVSLRMGKYKGSFYMVSDYKDVGYAYPWVRPPLEVYSTNPIKALSGLNLVYQTNLGSMSLLTELYVGSGTHTGKYLPSTTDAPSGSPYFGLSDPTLKGKTINFETPNSKGVNVSLSGDIGTFRLGYYQTQVNASAFNLSQETGSFLGLGFNIDWRNLVVYSEYIQRDTSANLAGAFPDQNAYYTTMGYRMGSYLPYVTYASLGKGKDDSPYAQLQTSVAFGLRTEVSDTSALKFEIMQVTPEKNSGSAGFNTTSAGYGLFYTPVKNGTVATVTFDVIF